MFTTGSKLFVGGTVVSVVGAIVFGASVGGPTGALGTIGLVTVALYFAFLAGINFFTRDGNVSATEPGVETTAAAARPPAGRSMWPIVTAVSLGGLAVGSVSKPVVFKVSVIVLLASIVEWMVQSWSERASADSAYNAGLRKRLLHPLEFPILATLGAAAFVYSFSRVMLNISKDSGRWVFIVIGAIITVAGFVFAAKRGMGKATAAGIVSLGAIALVGVGVASALSGQRTIEKHPEINTAVCLGTATPEVIKEVDAKASQRVAAKSNPLANVELTKDNRLIAFPFGIGNIEYHELTVPRSLTVHVVFRNFSDTPRRLTVHMGTFKLKDGTSGAEQADCTTAVEKGGTGFLTFRLTKSQLASSTPYTLTVPGVDGADGVIKLMVP
jgi:hypothetical protein